tara:strand:- start:621 stop:863 length:243 start_codon:yes stop_codon:yes gene_type:complete
MVDKKHIDSYANQAGEPTVASPIEPVIMSRRDYFAAAALQGLLANSFSDGYNQPLSMASQEEMAAMARDQADHLIKALAS